MRLDSRYRSKSREIDKSFGIVLVPGYGGDALKDRCAVSINQAASGQRQAEAAETAQNSSARLKARRCLPSKSMARLSHERARGGQGTPGPLRARAICRLAALRRPGRLRHLRQDRHPDRVGQAACSEPAVAEAPEP